MARRKKLNEEMPKKECMGKGGSKKEERPDMSKVKALKAYQKARNFELKGTGLKCNLNPKKELEQCQTCVFHENCKKWKTEREYIIRAKDTTITAKRRINRGNKAVMKEEIRSSHENVGEEIKSSYEDMEEEIHPCGEWSYACPEEKKCRGICKYETT